MNIQRIIVGAAMTLTAAAASAQTWNAATAWNPPTNPTGVWSYGEFNSNGVFVAENWDSLNNMFDWNYRSDLGGDIWMNTIGYPQQGIANGQLALNDGFGTPVVQFTAPSTGDYDFDIAIGGTEATQANGNGNLAAAFGNVQVNGVVQNRTSFISNVALWSFSTPLTAGQTVDAYVMSNGVPNGANTALTFESNFAATPEPAPLAVLGLGALGLAFRPRRRK